MLQVRAEPAESIIKTFRRNTCNGEQRRFGWCLQYMSNYISLRKYNSWRMPVHFRKKFRLLKTTPDRRCRCCACYTRALHNHVRRPPATSQQIHSL